MNKLISVLAVLAASTLVACTQTRLTNNVPVAHTTSMNALEILSIESQKALNAAQHLAKYQESYNATLDYRQREFDADKIMIDYIGKPPAVLNSIAIRYGYRYIELGTPQELPTVNFTKYWTTPEGAVIDIDAKIGEMGSIAVDKQQKIITLVYPSAYSTETNQEAL